MKTRVRSSATLFCWLLAVINAVSGYASEKTNDEILRDYNGMHRIQLVIDREQEKNPNKEKKKTTTKSNNGDEEYDAGVQLITKSSYLRSKEERDSEDEFPIGNDDRSYTNELSPLGNLPDQTNDDHEEQKNERNLQAPLEVLYSLSWSHFNGGVCLAFDPELEILCENSGQISLLDIVNGVGVDPSCTVEGNSRIICTPDISVGATNAPIVDMDIEFTCAGSSEAQLRASATSEGQTLSCFGDSNLPSHSVALQHLNRQTGRFVFDSICDREFTTNSTETNSTNADICSDSGFCSGVCIVNTVTIIASQDIPIPASAISGQTPNPTPAPTPTPTRVPTPFPTRFAFPPPGPTPSTFLPPSGCPTCPAGSTSFQVEIIPDDEPQEIDWVIRRVSNSVVVSNLATAGDFSFCQCLSDSDCYDFIITDSAGNGICCGSGQGRYDLFFGDEQIVDFGGNYLEQEVTRFGASPTCPTASLGCPTCPAGNTNFRVDITPDDEPDEIDWVLRRVSNNGVISTLAEAGGFSFCQCLPDSDCYDFAITDSAGNGLCCGAGQGSYDLYFGDQKIVDVGGNFLEEEVTRFGASPTCPTANLGCPTCPAGNTNFRVEITPDDEPQEIDWILRRVSNNGVISTLETAGSFSFCQCLPDSDCYDFTITDSAENGICCGSGQGSYDLYFGDQKIVDFGGNFLEQEVTRFGASPSCPTANLGCPTCAPGNTQFLVEITPDDEPQEVDWVLRRVSDNVAISNLAAAGGFNFCQCLPDSECYDFTITDSAGNGLCCGSGQGKYDLVYGDQKIVDGGGNFLEEEATRFGASPSCPNAIPGCPTCEVGSSNFVVAIVPDDEPQEIDWFLRRVSDNAVISTLEAAGGFNSCLCLADSECYDFTITDSAGNGLCCGSGFGTYDLVYGNQNVVVGGGNYLEQEVTRFGASPSCTDATPIPTEAPSLAPTRPPFTICFSALTQIYVENKGVVYMKDLRLGDKVLTANQKFESVYSFGHHDPSARAHYIRIHTDVREMPLEISADHMIYRVEGGHHRALPASMVRIGDILVTGNDQVENPKVVMVDGVVGDGAFAPFTPSGTIVVNGLVVSTFVAFSESHANDMGVSYQWIAHTFEGPHRWYCTLLDCSKESYHAGTGISNWVYGPWKLAHWMVSLKDGQGVVSPILFGVASVAMLCALGIFWVLDHGTWFAFAAIVAMLVKRLSIRVDIDKAKGAEAH